MQGAFVQNSTDHVEPGREQRKKHAGQLEHFTETCNKGMYRRASQLWTASSCWLEELTRGDENCGQLKRLC